MGDISFCLKSVSLFTNFNVEMISTNSCFFYQEKTTNPNTEEIGFYENLGDLFPQRYTTEEVQESESGKLQVLMKLLQAIKEQSPSER